MKLLTVVGARPQFIKAAAVGYAIEDARGRGARLDSVLVHTGQHYDFEMSRQFFDELGLQAPQHSLEVGSGSHGAQTGRMLESVERVLLDERPDIVLVYGDTNSTLAGALAAIKLHIPVAHVEAGLRSFNMRMPEEINRILTDRISRWLFCPTEIAVANLAQEGVAEHVHLVGDVMYELVMRYAASAPAFTVDGETVSSPFILVTIHRAENTDDQQRLRPIVAALGRLAEHYRVIMPVHPRTAKALTSLDTVLPPALQMVRPLGYLQMLAAQKAASVVITDSGGVQKEAYWVGTPCVTVRTETEWPETLADERNVLAPAEIEPLVDIVRRQLARGRLTLPAVAHPAAASAILARLLAD